MNAPQAPVQLNPQDIWDNLRAGNERFATGHQAAPNRDASRRLELRAGQSPRVVVLACSDSRVPVEITFDQGLGDVFVVRTAGHILDPAVLASVQYALDSVGCNLLVVLGHEACGAVAATASSVLDGQPLPSGFQREIVERVSLSAHGGDTTEDIERRHTSNTVDRLLEMIPDLKRRVEVGEIGVVGGRYLLESGTVEEVCLHGVA